MSASLILWKVSATAYNAISIREEIEGIWRSISNIYSDISTAHVNSALQAISAAEHSKFHEHEILDAISHLRDAYNVCESVLGKTKTVLFFWDKYLISGDEDRNKYLMYLAHLAGIISILYKSLNEHQTADEWKNIAIAKFESGFDIPLDTLYIINDKYVVRKKHWGYSVTNPHNLTSKYDYETNEKKTPEGEKYVQAEKLAQTKEFGKLIDQKRLELKQLVKP